MISSRAIAGGAIALFTMASLAAEPTQSPTRAQVKQGVLEARAAGQLRVGEDPYYPYGREAAVIRPARSKAKKTKSRLQATTADSGAIK